MEYSVSNEECTENINGIVHMAKEDDDGKKKWEENKKVSKKSFRPPDKCQEKRQAGMAREKQITAKTDVTHDTRGVNHYLRWERGQVSQGHKDGTNQIKQGNTFKNKRHSFEIIKTSKNDRKKHKKGTVNVSGGDIEGRNIAQNEVRHRIAGFFGGVKTGKIIHHQA